MPQQRAASLDGVAGEAHAAPAAAAQSGGMAQQQQHSQQQEQALRQLEPPDMRLQALQYIRRVAMPGCER
jgi:hypothetical protein